MTGAPELSAIGGDLGRMPLFGTAHLVALGATAVISVTLVVLVRRNRGSPAVDRWCGRVGWALLVISVGWMLWDLLPPRFDLAHSLPVGLSDLARVIIPLALLTRSGWTVAVAYYWGLSLNLMALLTPDLSYSFFPPLEYGMFWLSHIAAFTVPVVLVWGMGLRPTWRGFGFAYLFTVGWAVTTMGVNAVTGANYGYLNQPPEGGSLLDLLGPWPVYLFAVATILAVGWALITWPWATRGLTAATVSTGAGLVRRPWPPRP